MTPPRDDDALREPWPGYADESKQARAEKLELKVDEARLRGDLLYAQAVSAAVANYEALARLQGAGDEPDEAERAARANADEVGAWGRKQFGEIGGWGHK